MKHVVSYYLLIVSSLKFSAWQSNPDKSFLSIPGILLHTKLLFEVKVNNVFRKCYATSLLSLLN